MAYDFQVEGWQDWEGERHEGPPTDISPEDVMGVFVHWFADGNDPTDGPDDYHWDRIDEPFDTWDEWYDYIAEMGEYEYGLSMA